MEPSTLGTPSTLDPLDLKLLHALQIDGRAPFSRIAEVLGVSDQTVARRFRRLRTTASTNCSSTASSARPGSSPSAPTACCTTSTAAGWAG